MTEYKVNKQKLIAFLYTDDEASEEEIKQAVPFTIAPKPILRNKFNQGSEKFVPANYKTLLRAIGENKQKESLCLWLRRINTKISILPKVIYTFNAILIKIPRYSLQ